MARRALRAVLLARVSTRKKSQDTSGPRQLAQLRDVASRRKWIVVEALTDRLSGGERNRPGLVAALDLIRNGKADVLAVHDLDRLGRDTRDLLGALDAIRAWGGDLFIRDANVDTTAEGRLGFTIIAALAEYQRRSNSAKVLAGLAHARKKGVRLGRPPELAGADLDRAVALRTNGKERKGTEKNGKERKGTEGPAHRDFLSWGAIAVLLGERYPRTTIATAVTRRLKTHPKTPRKNLGKTRSRAKARVVSRNK